MLRSVPPRLPPRSIDPRAAAALILGYLDSARWTTNRTPDPLLSRSPASSNCIRDDDVVCPALFRCCAPGSSLPRHPSSPPSSLFYRFLFLFFSFFFFFSLYFLSCSCLQLSCFVSFGYDFHPQDPSLYHFLPLVRCILVQPLPNPHHGSQRQEDSG